MPNEAESGRLGAILSLAGAAAIAMLIPFVILLVGTPVALAVRLVSDAVVWLSRLIFGG